MNNWFGYICAFCVIISTCNCSGVNFSQWHFPYMMEVQQGNYITKDQAQQLHPGMTKEQVTYTIGHPLTQFMFDQNRWDFFYQDFKNYSLKQNYTISIFFDKNNKITSITQTGQPFNK